ncbi:hypothetical protein Rhal01_02449 [Rubritalea halochordaticola]|uniref:Thioredoxin domain-containing protein n=1 Tax=Rubritalea halochordaticola TaxID=714537 RepID=A0ABP9V594_9BACT
MEKQNKQIVMIYAGVAMIAVALVVGFAFIAKARNQQAQESEERRQSLRHPIIVETIQPLTELDKQLTEDLRGRNQDGEEVGLYDLKGKVVVFAQFYSRCSMCLGHNRIIMQDLHESLQGNPDVQFVTVTVDPEFDSPEKLKEMAELWGAKSDSWWMLNVPKDKLEPYCREQMWYVDFKENENATSIADGIMHDMGIAVIDPTSKMRAKVNLYELKVNEKEDEYQARKAQLLEVIENALKAKSTATN